MPRLLRSAKQHGYEVTGTFLDTEVDGTNGEGFRQMLGFLGRPDLGFTVVVVDSMGALGSDLGRVALRMLNIEATGAQVYSAHTGNEIARDLITTWADRGEGTPVSERVRSAMRRKAVRGEVLGRPPYGYRVGPRRKLELISEEALVVRYIFRLYLQDGLGIRRIAGQLNDENIPTRRGRPLEHGHRPRPAPEPRLSRHLHALRRESPREPPVARLAGRLPARAGPPPITQFERHDANRDAVPPERARLLRPLRVADDRRQPPPELDHERRREALRRLPLLPVRKPDEPELLRLQHPALERTRRARARTARRARLRA